MTKVSGFFVRRPLLCVVAAAIAAAWCFRGNADRAFAADVEQKLTEIRFETDAPGWRSERFCRAYVRDRALRIEADGGPPTLSRIVDRIGGQIRIVAEIQTLTPSEAVVFWTTRGSPRRSDDKKISQTLVPDGQWHSYEFLLPVPDVLTGISLRFTSSEGHWDIRSIAVFRRRSHPLEVRRIVPYKHEEATGNVRDMLRYTIYNDAPEPLTFRVDHLAEEVELAGRQAIDLAAPIQTEGNLAAVNLMLHPKRFPTIGFPVFLYREEGTTDWISRPIGAGTNAAILDVAPDARMARLRRGDDVFAIVAPLVHRNGVIPKFSPVPNDSGQSLHFESPEVVLTVEPSEESVRFRIEDKMATGDANRPLHERLEGPVVRLFGTMQSGLLPGVEFLGVGDVSSSKVDIEEPYNDRSVPNPLWLTMPLAVLGTDRGAVLLRWSDPTLQPTFSSPNRFDRTDDHRVSLIGSKIEATLEILATSTRSGESAALRGMRRHVAVSGFPEPPAAPRSSEEQRHLCLRALTGPIQAEDGARWGYAVETDWPRQPFADLLSTVSRLSGKVPTPQSIVPGGADIANDSIYFLTERAEEWIRSRDQAIRSILALRNPDGSFLHRTRFPEVETAATSFGYTAIRALEIMEFVRWTGNRDLFESVAQSMEYLKRCDVPRGGFYQDSPLHTPDLYTAASLVWLFAWAFEQTGETEYLELARRYAFGGLPFVYQWSDREIMLYVTVPKFGGTERRLPTWFASSQPRVGLVYAYALQILARHDPTVDWRRLSLGILHATEAIQFSDGPEAGCVPEIFVLANQERRSWKVNPGALVSLRLALEGKTDSLDVLQDGTERYVAPYPLRATPRGVEAYDVPEGRRFQVLRNGRRIGNAVGPGLLSLD